MAEARRMVPSLPRGAGVACFLRLKAMGFGHQRHAKENF